MMNVRYLSEEVEAELSDSGDSMSVSAWSIDSGFVSVDPYKCDPDCSCSHFAHWSTGSSCHRPPEPKCVRLDIEAIVVQILQGSAEPGVVDAVASYMRCDLCRTSMNPLEVGFLMDGCQHQFHKQCAKMGFIRYQMCPTCFDDKACYALQYGGCFNCRQCSY